jgi:ribosomal-protein-serine acetyltransferase
MRQLENNLSVVAAGFRLPLELVADDEVNLQLVLPNNGSETYDLVDANRDFLKQHLKWVGDYTPKKASDENGVLAPANLFEGSMAPYRIMYHGTYVGEVDLHARKRDRAYIGYWMAEDVQGKGIMTRAASRLRDFGFKDWGLNTLFLQISAKNEPSKAVAGRIGARYLMSTIPGIKKDEIWKVDK